MIDKDLENKNRGKFDFYFPPICSQYAWITLKSKMISKIAKRKNGCKFAISLFVFNKE